jgi:DNA-directed RNA polymerase subunit RPC12/RpoP
MADNDRTARIRIYECWGCGADLSEDDWGPQPPKQCPNCVACGQADPVASWKIYDQPRSPDLAEREAMLGLFAMTDYECRSCGVELSSTHWPEPPLPCPRCGNSGELPGDVWIFLVRSDISSDPNPYLINHPDPERGDGDEDELPF